MMYQMYYYPRNPHMPAPYQCMPPHPEEQQQEESLQSQPPTNYVETSPIMFPMIQTNERKGYHDEQHSEVPLQLPPSANYVETTSPVFFPKIQANERKMYHDEQHSEVPLQLPPSANYVETTSPVFFPKIQANQRKVYHDEQHSEVPLQLPPSANYVETTSPVVFPKIQSQTNERKLCDERRSEMPLQLPPPPRSTNYTEASSIVYSMIQTNGRKVYGPPEDWVGPPPNSSCELYIRRIPKSMSEQKILEPFLRFGKIYQFRVPIDFVQGIRGYAYVRYTNEEDAGCALEVLNHHFIEPGKTLDIVNSCEKCRLFVSNIPKHLTEEEIEKELKTIFPTMLRIHSKGQLRGKDQNHGYVFVNFATHNDALEAKKSTCPGIVRLWGNDLKIVWANSESVDNTLSNKTLFVRNVDLKLNNRDLIEVIVQHVSRTTVRKISKVRTNAFVDFTCRQAAETVMMKLQGSKVGDSKFVIEWAKPSEKQSLHRMCNSDFDALLRLKCIANNWSIPVVIFGTFFERENIQYAAVLLRNAECPLRFIIVTLQTKELVDIHSRLSEVVVTLIDRIGGFPDCNYVFWAQKDTAYLLGAVNPNPHMAFIASHGVPKDFKLDLIEVIDLSWACGMLAKSSEQRLLQLYQQSFLVHSQFTFLTDFIFTQRIFGTIMPKYRNKPPLKYNLNDTQIVLALCYQATGSNCSFGGREYNPWELTALDCGHNGLPYMNITLLPLSLTQSRFPTSYVLHQVVFGGTSYYSPSQTIMTPPLWISGVSYSESIKQVPFGPKLDVGMQK